MGDEVADDRWLAAEDIWMRWHIAVLIVAISLVAARVTVVDASERAPALLVAVAFAVSLVAAVVTWKTTLSSRAPAMDSWQVRDDWKGRSRQDWRVTLAALRARAPVRVDLVRPAVRLARHRALLSRGLSWGPLMLTGQIVARRLDGVFWTFAVSMVALVLVMTWCRWESLAQYRAVREQLNAVVARDDDGASTSGSGCERQAGDEAGPR